MSTTEQTYDIETTAPDAPHYTTRPRYAPDSVVEDRYYRATDGRVYVLRLAEVYTYMPAFWMWYGPEGECYGAYDAENRHATPEAAAHQVEAHLQRKREELRSALERPTVHPARPAHRCRRCGETAPERFGNGGPVDLCDDCQEDQ